MKDRTRSRWIWPLIVLLAALDVAEAVYLGWLNAGHAKPPVLEAERPAPQAPDAKPAR